MLFKGHHKLVEKVKTPLDILADKMDLPPAELGDLVVVFQSGAYAYSASPRDFLSHPQPLQIVV